jgi:GT2 family glycosyltransferase
MLDERMFYGWEDTDYCVRMWRAGYPVVYYPEAAVIHHEQRLTTRRPFSRLALEHFKSMVLFFLKYPKGIWGRYA